MCHSDRFGTTILVTQKHSVFVRVYNPVVKVNVGGCFSVFLFVYTHVLWCGLESLSILEAVV